MTKHKPLENYFRSSNASNSIIDLREGLAKILGPSLNDDLFLNIAAQTRDFLRTELLFRISKKLGNGTAY